MAKQTDKTGAYILSIVGVVAAVGLFTMFLGGGSGDSLSGAAVQAWDTQSTTTTYTKWTTCLDMGNMIKLGNPQGGTLVKKDACTGQEDKMLVMVSCAQDVDGGFTYKYSNPIQCASTKSCMKDENGAAYCG